VHSELFLARAPTTARPSFGVFRTFWGEKGLEKSDLFPTQKFFSVYRQCLSAVYLPFNHRAPPTNPRTLTMRLRPRANSDLMDSNDGISTNDDSTEKVTLPDSLPDEPPPSTQASPIILDPKQDNCSALARHLFSHVKNLHFNTKAEVADWCRSNLEIKIIWRSNTISLLKSASTKNCRLCAVEQMAIGRHFGSKNIINLKSELRGICSCKTRFLWFARSG
jgi:hypothetical protein